MLWNRLKNNIQLNLYHEITDIKIKEKLTLQFYAKLTELILRICLKLNIFTVKNQFIKKQNEIPLYKHVCILNETFYKNVIYFSIKKILL
jgi:hypothetical protein